ncbi:peptidase S8, partial [Streptomyces sp. NPDC058953]
MAHPGTRRRRVTALTAGLALTATLGFLPAGAASAADAAVSAGAAAAVPAASFDGPQLSYVVNVKG